MSPITSRLPQARALTMFALLLASLIACNAGAKTHSFGQKYQLELGDGWTIKQPGPELKAMSANGVSLNAGAYANATTLESFADQMIAALDAKPGYKMAERGTVRVAGGIKAELIRYNVDMKGTAITSVTYVMPLGAKEVAVVTFGFPTAGAKTARSEVERVANSVQVAKKGDADDSWLTPSASAAAESSAGGTAATTGGSAAKQQAGAAGTAMKFGNCTLELPAGWKAERNDDMLEGEGPGGATLIASAFDSPNPPDKVLDTRLATFKGAAGYELLDIDPVATKAGAKGKLAYYKHQVRGKMKAEIAVAIAMGNNQIALLLISAPLTDGEPDRSFMNATEALYSSVKLAD